MKINVRKLKQVLKEKDIENELDPSIEERIEKEIHSILDEMESGYHSDSIEYEKMLKALKELVELRNAINSKKKIHIDWNTIIPILIKAGVSLVAISFWISLENGRPVSMRLANWTNNLLRC